MEVIGHINCDMPLLLCVFVFGSFLNIITTYAICFMLSFLSIVTAYAGYFMLDFPALPGDLHHTFYVVLVSQSSRLHFAESH